MSKRYPSRNLPHSAPRLWTTPCRWAMPRLWLLSDARNDAQLERILRRLPAGSGFVFRHSHLPPEERRQRFNTLRRICRSRHIRIALSGTDRMARRWGADCAYGPGEVLATAHSLRELRRLGKARAVLLSPVHATRSHPGARPLGPVRFLLLAKAAPVPVIALGGMTAKRAKALPVYGWAAIDGLTSP